MSLRTGQQCDHQATLRAFWESAPHALIGLDLDCRVCLWSAASERLLGFDAEAVLGRPLPLLLTSDEAELARVCQRARDEDRTQTYATACRRAGQRPLRVKLEVVAVRSHSVDQGYCLTLTPLPEDELAAMVPLRALLDQLPLRISYLGPDLRYRLVNAGYTSWFGRPREAIQGRHVRELLGSTAFAIAEPYLRRALAGATVQYSARFQDHQGQERLLEVRYVPDALPGGPVAGLFVILSDATERNEIEESQRISSLRWQSLVEHNPDMVMLVERDSTILYINRVAQGVTREQIIGTLGVEYVDAEYREQVIDQYARAWDRQEMAEFVVPTHFAGQAFWHYCRLAPLVRDGKTECLLAVVRDLTSQKRAEAERVAMECSLLEAQHLESLGVMAGGIAHDFNNLIAGILGSAHLAAHECDSDSPAHEYLRQIEQNSFRAAELCKQMLAYAGKGRFVLEALDVNRALEGLRTLAQAVLPEGATLEYRLTESLPPIRADETQLRRVVLSLITNAAEALSADGGTVTVATALRAVDADDLRAHGLDPDAAPEDYVAIEVGDDGVGIEPHVRPRIFEPFFTTKFLGRGLGLAAAQGIVRAHAGLIDVWSEPGRGSRLTVLLPRAEAATSGAYVFRAVE